MELRDWIVLIPVAMQALYAALTFHRDRNAAMRDISGKLPRRPTLIIASFMVMTWAAVAFDYFSRPAIASAEIIYYGLVPPKQFHAIAKLRNWGDYLRYKAFLITRTVYSDRDRMSDDWIAKSIAYTIDRDIISMVSITNN